MILGQRKTQTPIQKSHNEKPKNRTCEKRIEKQNKQKERGEIGNESVPITAKTKVEARKREKVADNTV